MIILLSPSKTLDFSPLNIISNTQPEYLDQTKKLLERYKQLSSKEIEKKMKVSSEIAERTKKMFENQSLPLNLRNAKQAIFTFTGAVYRDLNPTNYSKKDIDFAQKNLRILSGLYGVLKPLDLIQPYRLEMKLVKSFWKNKIIFSKDKIINLASQEYFSAITCTQEVFTPIFKEKKDGEYKIITIYTKFAR